MIPTLISHSLDDTVVDLAPPGGAVEALELAPRGLLIGASWRAASGGRRLPVENPASGRILCEVADADEADCRAALDAACAAERAWTLTAPVERAAVLRRAASALRRGADAFAALIALDAGKPLAEGLEEVALAAEYLEWYAEEAVRIPGRLQELPQGGCLMLVRPRPIGPCLIVTPWNFPLTIPARGVAPALAAGCTVVLRASDRAPLAALALARLLAEAGLPPGALNVVTSSRPDATDGLLADPRLRKLTFTGSAPVGRHLARLAADGVARVGVELGGRAPFIVFDDANLDSAVSEGARAKCRNAGQACTAANQFLVHRDVLNAFTVRLAARLAALRIGPGTAAGSDLGPVITAAQQDRLGALVDDAVRRGARVVLPGGAMPGRGHFFAPVVLRDVPEGAAVLDEEIFGPVAVVRGFAEEDEALRMANAGDLGLAAYVWTGDLARALRVAGGLECGMVGVNATKLSAAAAPFGGRKGSGHARAGGPEGLAEYLATSYLAVAVPR
jgi:succinate-semialdehyde dehydrogenase/glutarate-semialdehyde dehydrogenase